MFALRTLIIGISLLNLAALLIFFFSSDSRNYAKNQELQLRYQSHYVFLKPLLAFDILRKLDRAPRLTYQHFNTNKPARPLYHQTYLGLKRDEEYCSRARGYFIDHSSNYFKKQSFLTDYLPQSLFRSSVLPKIGYDVMPNISFYQSLDVRDQPLFDISPNINNFFMNTPLHNYQEIDKNFLCFAQTYNHIPGSGSIARKDLMAKAVADYAQVEGKRPGCFDTEKYFLQSYLLDEIEQCKDFFEYIQSQDYRDKKQNEGVVFIRKTGIGSHKGEGVYIVDADEEKELKEIYELGKQCGEIRNSYIIQRYINEPLLILGHKFDIRVYMLIASANPPIVYYHDGYLRISQYEYEPNSTHQTSSQMSSDGSKFDATQEWNLTVLTDYLIETQRVKKEEWLDQYLRSAFKEAMIHLVRMTQDSFYKHSGTYELFGMDFLLGQNLNLWFLESNSSPVLKGNSKEKQEFFKKMLTDMFEIVYNYMQSRLFRIIKYVNWLSKDQIVESKFLSGIIIPNLEERQEEFKELSKNKMNAEFNVSNDNNWVRIIDANLEGIDRYSGFITESCL